jgi:hypothetical protein
MRSISLVGRERSLLDPDGKNIEVVCPEFGTRWFASGTIRP